MTKRSSKSVVKEDGLLTVESTVILGPGEKPLNKRSQKKLKVRPFATEVAKVSIGAHATIPGPVSYSSIKTSVTLSVPCYLEEILDVYKDMDALVDKLMDRKVEQIQKGIKKGEE